MTSIVLVNLPHLPVKLSFLFSFKPHVLVESLSKFTHLLNRFALVELLKLKHKHQQSITVAFTPDGGNLETVELVSDLVESGPCQHQRLVSELETLLNVTIFDVVEQQDGLKHPVQIDHLLHVKDVLLLVAEAADELGPHAGVLRTVSGSVSFGILVWTCLLVMNVVLHI